MELDLYSTIEYSPGWYYQKFPGFWNVECYKILSDYSMHPEKYTDPGVEEEKTLETILEQQEEEVHETIKRKVDTEIRDTCVV